jgi:hypothetical protein
MHSILISLDDAGLATLPQFPISAVTNSEKSADVPPISTIFLTLHAATEGCTSIASDPPVTWLITAIFFCTLNGYLA